MKQDIPFRGPQCSTSSRSSTFDYSTSGVPYRPLQLSRHRVILPDEVSVTMRSGWKRLLLMSVMLGFGAVCLHGGLARRVILWTRSISGFETTQQMAFEPDR